MTWDHKHQVDKFKEDVRELETDGYEKRQKDMLR